ncbi:MAG TPA: aspartate/glutamate racemase family protein [Acidimicrobiales bacterium]|nr:aspartate/glutamate racemase family protein [Acidimicrobiales bacterium]
MPRIGFLHTADVHVATFTSLLGVADPGATGTHVVDDTLLADARRDGGVGDELRERILRRLREAAAGNDAVLCTCSSVSGTAEALGADVGVPVVRIDRPLARVAVAAGGIVAVVAAVESTLAPTRELLLEEAALQKVRVTLIERPCPEAWRHFEAGDMEAYLDAIAQHVDAVADSAEVVVLAQASMAGAATRCRTSTPVLSSPVLGVEAVLAAASR